ncbi:MAG: GNAT family N-acetyltransferase [Candidatus Latescibacteria bacterium]|nr:GNAT family N-acetyltransferase [Candidatus Latescibacterota bacterium]
MQIREIPLHKADQLTAFYNEEFAQVPFAFPLDSQAFLQGVRYHEDRDTPYQDLDGERLYSASSEDEILAVAHVARWRSLSEEASNRISRTGIPSLPKTMGVLRFFHCRRDCADAGHAVLATAEDYLQGMGLSQIRASGYYGYRFHRFCHGVFPDCLDYVLGLLRQRGYEISYGKQLMHRTLTPPADFGPERLALKQHPLPSRGTSSSWRFDAYLMGEKAGQTAVQPLDHFCPNPEARDHFYLNWFGIEEHLRGQGLGTDLLAQALANRIAAGFRHALLYVDQDNAIAQRLYRRAGFTPAGIDYMLYKPG